MKIQAIITTPPYADFLEEAARHPLVCGFRLNTVMPIKGSHAQILSSLAEYGQPVWVDLKGRQLRVIQAAVPPYTEVLISHSITVDTPVDAYFSDGKERVRVMAVDGNRLILEDGPRRLVGPGESVNIVHPSLKIEGTLTETDLAYLAAMKQLNMTQVMLSYVEHPGDVEEVHKHLPDAEMMLKIETRRGLEYAKKHRESQGRLVAARGDLYVEVQYPHQIVDAVRDVIQADPQAVVASRIFESLVYDPVPSNADIGDVAFLMSLGYQTFMLGDSVCLQRDTVIEALNLLEAVASQF